MGVVDLGQAHMRELIVDLSCFLRACFEWRKWKILLLLTMSLYRFFAKAGMPPRVPSLSDKEIENANASVKKLQEKEVTSRSPRWPIRYNDPPNLMPAKFSGYKVCHLRWYPELIGCNLRPATFSQVYKVSSNVKCLLLVLDVCIACTF